MPPSPAPPPESGRETRPLEALIEEFLHHPSLAARIVHVERQPAQAARFGEWPATMAPELRAALAARGLERPYSHQAEAIDAALAGRDVVVVTPTASGKTLCYNVPVVQQILQDQNARALYLFPTKALSHDQYRELHGLTSDCGRDIRVYTYDGDTPPATRRALRDAGHIIVTNPDMLHCGILPHHTGWIKLFENLRLVVIDELHQYRGVFGSHLANVLRRFDRLCRFYGTRPTFVCCSATIANPCELARDLTGRDFALVDQSGAPRGERTFVFYNPPVINKELNVRKSVRLEATRLASRFIARGRQTIIFGSSRVQVEVMTTYLKRFMARLHRDPDRIAGYRSGYLPTERRRIEQGIKSGHLLGVVSTNALELGVDIGGLDVSILAGYPGTIASAWQQAGRAGRKATPSLAVYVGSNSPIDQFLMAHPEYFFAGSPEQGIVNPDNLAILASHLKCGTFELPFTDGESFGGTDPRPVLQMLEDERIARHSGGRWHYASDAYPAENVSLRTGVNQNFVVLDTGNANRVLGEVDYNAAPFLIHTHAIYIHNAVPYYVERLEWDRRTAYVRQKDVDYYTDAEASSNIQVLSVDQEIQPTRAGSVLEARRFGDVSVATVVAKFKKVKFETHESVGYGDVSVPQLEIQTEAMWLTFREDLAADYKARGIELSAALQGLAHLLRNTVPIHVMCDPRDIGVSAMLRSPHDQRPTVIVWDRFPGGIGLARRLFGMEARIHRASLDAASRCGCTSGCPACVGPELASGPGAKSAAAALLRDLLEK
ncbi:MAG: DEAD/DEAH box helicase [Candidatus Sumerlaeia bacterium]|nr:DEAD/DEAH box helicase [Candidatus Sumerlaeia bacterium]